jgi:NADPH:quinone reductase-like Zn-dependent oxidoreductase
VTGIAVGDRVAATVFPEWQDGPFRREVAAQLGTSRPGALTELAVLPATGVVPVPDHLSYPEAATYPLTGVTAWHALFGGRPVRAGETVLTLGTGGVSLHALQFAKAAGARVIATTSSAAKAAELTALGADHVVDHRANPDWSAEVRALTGGAGVDHVVEVAGSITQSLRSAGYGAEVALIGTWLADGAPVAPRELFAAGAVIRPVAVGSRQHALEMNRAIGQLRLRPLVHRVFGFDEVPDALRYQAKGGFLGKVVIALD